MGFPSLGDPAGNIYQAPPNMNVIQELSLQPPDEGSIHPIPGRRAADFPKGQAHFPAAIDIDTWIVLPETRELTECSFLPAPLAPEGPAVVLRGAYIGLPTKFNTYSDEGTQMVRAQMPCTAYFDPAHDFANALLRALDLQGYAPNTVSSSFSSNRNSGGFIHVAGHTPGTNPRDACANPSVYHSTAVTQGGRMNTIGVPVRNGLTISTISVRVRGRRSRPQTFEGDVKRLYDRLICEGADIGAACVLRFIIFENGVTFLPLFRYQSRLPSRTLDAYRRRI